MTKPKPINPSEVPEMIEDDEGFARFEEMTKRLMRVSKGEIDAREAEYKAQRQARKGSREAKKSTRHKLAK